MVVFIFVIPFEWLFRMSYVITVDALSSLCWKTKENLPIYVFEFSYSQIVLFLDIFVKHKSWNCLLGYGLVYGRT